MLRNLCKKEKLEQIVSQLEAAVSYAHVIELVGDGACGKTTALKLLQNQLYKKGINLGVFTDEQIVDALLSEITASSGKNTDAHKSFREKFADYDVIAIDDFDLLVGRPLTAETLLQLLVNTSGGIRPIILAERKALPLPGRERYIVETIGL